MGSKTTEPEWVSDDGARAGGPALYDYERSSTFAGEFEDLDAHGRVRLRRPPGARPRRQLLFTGLVMLAQVVFLVWLIQPSHFPNLSRHPLIAAASWVVAGSMFVIELFQFINVSSLCIASTFARDPVPVAAQAGTRVAFLTTIVPSKEPLKIVAATLEAAQRIRHPGPFELWLLDEEDDPGVRALCAELGVHHFSRFGIDRYNQSSGQFKTRSKHGNYNAWIDAHGDDYEFFVSVDPDHVPQPNLAERLLGYFRDPSVAFVVGPQVYGNHDNFVTRGAESQQFVFHGLIQRLGNTFGAPMLVGTNNAIRISALRQIGGLRDSITEDLATSLAVHSATNPATGARWRSVYTPDVVAVGEGPSNFTDYFSQQHRWCRGTFETLRGQIWRSARTLTWGSRLHYGLITSYYPTAAISWTLGGLSCALSLIFGANGLRIDPHVWIAVYVDLALVQFALYVSNRRYNVSPHEEPGTSGAIGMAMSAMAAPIYVVALLQSLRGSEGRFVVTPKGQLRSVDRLVTFRLHLGWAGGLVLAAGVSLLTAQSDPHVANMRIWAGLLVAVCFTPLLISLNERRRQHRLPSVSVALRPTLVTPSADDAVALAGQELAA